MNTSNIHKYNKNLIHSMMVRITAVILTVIVIITSFSYQNLFVKADNGKSVNILFTHDIHSYLSSYRALHDGKVQEIGGMARLSTLIKQVKAERDNVFVFDGGDLAIGTLYQTVYATDALELKMLGRLGFDATTFGNHDFDYNYDKLVQMFNSAAAASYEDENVVLPAFTVCNIDWTKDNEETKAIKNAADKCNLCEYTVIEKEDYRVAVFGLFGENATEDSPTLKLDVLKQIESAKKTVENIKNNEDVDMIVCLSHSGTDDKLADSEDEQLAMAVPEIDVIISAHSHTLLQKPKIYGNTYIVSCGCYGEYTGLASFTQNADGRWDISEYSIIPMTTDIEEDEEVSRIIEQYHEVIEGEYLNQFGLKMDEVIAVSDYDFELIDDMYYVQEEHALGNLMSDAYRYAVNNTDYGKEHPAQISVVPAGTVRGSFMSGNITTADAFQCYSLGMGYDGQVGFPLVYFYLTGSEVKLIPEVDATLSSLMASARLYNSGLSYTIGNKRMFLNKAYNITLNPDVMSERSEQIEDDKLYSVVTDLYTARMLGSVSRLSKGLLKIIPKYIDGTPLESDEDDYLWENVVARENDGSELKTWYAIAEYLMSFDKNQEGISVIPEYYNEQHGRKIINDNFSLKIFLSQTNKYFWMISGVVLVVVFVIAFAIIGLVKKIKSIKNKKSNSPKIQKE